MYRCEYPNCGAEYTSALAASVCYDDDAERDHNNRGYFKRADPNRKD